jgi:ATP-dependent Clp protease ATP-binding subunit ClpB
LVGEPGVGKSAIVGALAMRFAAGDVPENLTKCAFLELDASALSSGARLRSEIDERLKSVLRAVGGGDTILFIDAIDALISQGGAASGAGDALKSVLARGEVRVLGTTTPEGLRKMNEKDAALVRRFTALTIEAPKPEQAIEILRGIATRYEAHHKVQIGDPAVVASVHLAKRYLQDRALPDTAIDLLDEAAARKRVEGRRSDSPARVDRSAALFTRRRRRRDEREDARAPRKRNRRSLAGRDRDAEEIGITPRRDGRAKCIACRIHQIAKRA